MKSCVTTFNKSIFNSYCPLHLCCVQYSNKNISMRGQKILKELCTHIFQFDNYKRIKINNKIHVWLTARISYLFRYCKHMQ